MKFSSFEQPTLIEEKIIIELKKHGERTKGIPWVLVVTFLVWSSLFVLAARLCSQFVANL